MRGALTVVAAVAALVLGVALTGGQAAHAVTSSSYVDPVGDSGVAPDLQNVTVAEDANGLVSFTFGVAGFPPPGGIGGIYICLDTDSRIDTGLRGVGCDYAIEAEIGAKTTTYFWSWAEGAPGFSLNPDYLFVSGTGPVTVSVPASHIGGVSSFSFYTYVSRGLVRDYGPNHGEWRYPGTSGPPPAPGRPQPTLPSKLVIGAPVTSGPAVAGHPFAAIFSVAESASGAPQPGVRATVRASVDGKRVRTSAHYADGNEHVSLVVPKGAAGATLGLVVHAAGPAGAASRTLTSKVAR